MKKSTLAVALIAGAISAQAAVITYDFNAGLDDSTSGSDLTAGTLAYAVGTNTDGGPEIAQRAWDSVNKASEDYLLSFTHRGLGNSGTADEDLTMTTAATLQLTLTPNSGESLNFSTSTLDFDSLLYTDGIAVRVGYKIWADTGSGFVALDALQTAVAVAGPGTEARLTQVDETTDLPDFSLTAGEVQSTVQSLSFDISSLGALADDQSVTLAIAMSSNLNNQFNFGSGIDDLVIDNVAIPEPATLGMIGAAGMAILLIRRRMVI